MRSPPPASSTSRARTRWGWWRPRRRTSRRCPTGSGRRWSSWPTRWSTATPRPLEVHRPDGVGIELAAEALDLLLHVGLREALEVADEPLRAAVALLVEAVDAVLVVDADGG